MNRSENLEEARLSVFEYIEVVLQPGENSSSPWILDPRPV